MSAIGLYCGNTEVKSPTSTSRDDRGPGNGLYSASVHMVSTHDPVLCGACQYKVRRMTCAAWCVREHPRNVRIGVGSRGVTVQRCAAAGAHHPKGRGTGVPRAEPGRLGCALRCCSCAAGRGRLHVWQSRRRRRSRPYPMCDHTWSRCTSIRGRSSICGHVQQLRHADLARFHAGDGAIKKFQWFRNSSNELVNAVQSPCQRYGIQCTDVTDGGQEAAPSSDPRMRIGKRIRFSRQ